MAMNKNRLVVGSVLNQAECSNSGVILIIVSVGTHAKKSLLQAIGRLFVAAAVVLCSVSTQAQPGPKGPGRRPGPLHDPRVATPDEAATAIQHAYDGISRTSVLRNSDAGGRVVNVNDVASESKTAYQEALSSYQANDYVGAREQAMASADMSRAVEELLMSGEAFGGRADVPTPPTAVEEHDRAARDLENLSYRLIGLKRRTTEGNALPAAAIAVVQSLVSRSELLQQQAQDLLLHGQPARAGHIARAGDALTHAGEHIQNRHLLAAGIIPTPTIAPPGPKRHPASVPYPREGPRR